MKDCKMCLKWLERTIIILETIIAHFKRQIERIKEKCDG